MEFLPVWNRDSCKNFVWSAVLTEVCGLRVLLVIIFIPDKQRKGLCDAYCLQIWYTESLILHPHAKKCSFGGHSWHAYAWESVCAAYTADGRDQNPQYISLDQAVSTSPVYTTVSPGQSTSRDGNYVDVSWNGNGMRKRWMLRRRTLVHDLRAIILTIFELRLRTFWYLRLTHLHL